MNTSLHKSFTQWEYFEKLHKLNLVPIYNDFLIKELKIFHRVMNNQINIEMPSYAVYTLLPDIRIIVILQHQWKIMQAW